MSAAEPLLDPAETAGLAAALDETSSPAFVIWADGQVALANAIGWAALDRVPEFVAARLRTSLGGRDQTFRVTRIRAPGAPRHYFAVQLGEAADPAAPLAAAAAR